MANIKKIYEAFLNSTGISTDSRNCKHGAMFVALKGDRFDGNQYVEQVIKNGARYAIANDPELNRLDNVFIVDDTLQTLQKLALHHRQQLNIPIISITGTNGKTTTKELVNAVLSKKYKTKATAGNFNNHIGVPLTLLSFDRNLEIGIVEMGANHMDEISLLCNIARPDYCLITNVGKAHLEGFGSFDGVMKAKGEMYSYAKEHDKLIFINQDNPHLVKMASENTIRYTYGKNADICGQITDVSPFISVKWHLKENKQQHIAHTKLIGAYNFENILAAITIGSYFNISNEYIKQALEEYRPSNNRSQLIKTSNNQIIMDAYNANPSSMVAAIDNFNRVKATNKWLILGGMKEMGQDSEAEHQKLINNLKLLTFEKVILIGQEFATFKTEFDYFNNNQEYIAHIKQHKPTGACILIKGSRGNKLEEILPFL